MGALHCNILRVTASLVLLAASPAMAASAKQPGESWLAAWDYPASPQPPGKPDPVIRSAVPRDPVPTVSVPGPDGVAMTVPLSQMPYTEDLPVTGVPIVPSGKTPELSGVTVRQIVRVSVAGKKLRLRLSNESSE